MGHAGSRAMDVWQKKVGQREENDRNKVKGMVVLVRKKKGGGRI